jgi:hypothetical protein
MTKCALCGTGINPTASGVAQRVVAWELKATASSRKSGSDIIGRQQLQEFACPRLHPSREGRTEPRPRFDDPVNRAT